MNTLILLSLFWLNQGFAATDSCHQCNTMTNCPQSAKDALEAAIDERAQAKNNNAKAGTNSTKKVTSGLKNQQLDPMQKAGTSASDCTKIAESCKRTMNAISEKIANVQRDLERGKQILSSCLNRPLSASDIQNINSELDYYIEEASSQKSITNAEANNCANAAKSCGGMAAQNSSNAERLKNEGNSANKSEEEKKGQGGGGGGSPPGGGAPPQQKPQESQPPKAPVNCEDMSNIEAPECKTKRCSLAQYSGRQECGADCSKPENQGYWKCTKTKNPTVQ